ncbi:hypothetical protein ILUMI_02054, partial [Ignelater luminosus]
MKWIFVFLITAAVTLILATKDELKITQEMLDDYDKSLLTITEFGVYKVNRTLNGLKANFTLLRKVDESAMIWVKAYKFLSNTYRLTAIQFAAPIVVMLKSKDFDLESLFLNYTKPPLVWPLNVGVSYVIKGWYPDSRKFPQNLLEGRWKVQTSIVLKDERKVCEFS